MNAKQKIGKVLKQIKEEGEINPDSRWVDYKFNTGLIAIGMLNDDEEKRILSKLQKEKIIKLHVPDNDGSLDGYGPEEFMWEHNCILVEILDGFDKKYQIYKLFYSDCDFWEITNLLWWLWKLIEFIRILLKPFAKIIKDNVIVSLLIFIITILAIDYTMAWRNLKYIIDLINKFLLQI